MRPYLRMTVACFRPVPWSVPQVFVKTSKAGKRYKSAARNPELEQWQAYVKAHAAEQMAGGAPTLRPLYVCLHFFCRTENPDLLGKVWLNGVAWNEKKESYVKTGETVPDVDNLAKATLDAMQGVVFGNDVQVCILFVVKKFGDFDGVKVQVNEFDGTADDDDWL